MNIEHLNGATPHVPDDVENEPFTVEELTEAAPRCTDSANADAFIPRHGLGFLYVVEWKKWISWDGRRWIVPGAKQRVTHAAMLSAREDYAISKGRLKAFGDEKREVLLKGDKEREEELEIAMKYEATLLKWHEQSQNMSRLNACVSALETRLTVSHECLDAKPWLLNCGNGTIDLCIGQLRQHDRDDLLTQMTEIDWDDDATCPTWNAFLDKSLNDTLLSLYVQRLVGYTLTGVTREHILIFLYGDGNNGKSVFLKTLQRLFGTYGFAAPRDLLFAPPNGARPHPTELASLFGKRLAVCSEVGEKSQFDEAKLKDLTGDDPISCRRMNEDYWTFLPVHTLWLAGNHKPTITGTDGGVWRRPRLIPWTIVIPESEVDKELGEKLAKELPGILRWAAMGTAEWLRNGLCEPPSVVVATASYRAESDVLGQFFLSQTVFISNGRITRKALRERFELWCRENGHEPIGGKRFSARLRKEGVCGCSVREGQRVLDGWAGIRVREGWEWGEPEPATSNLTS